MDQLGSLNEKVKRGLRVLRSFASAIKVKYGEVEIGLDIDPERGVGDSGDIENDLPDLLVAIARPLRREGQLSRCSSTSSNM